MQDETCLKCACRRRQSLDLYIPSLRTAIEYQGVQHYCSVDFFGGEEALTLRQELDQLKKQQCLENHVRLIEWPYTLDPTERNVKKELLKERYVRDGMSH